MAFLIAASGSYCLSRVLDQGIADSLGLITLRHGTDPVTWLRLHTNGLTKDSDQTRLAELVDETAQNSFTATLPSDEYGVNFGRIFDSINDQIQMTEQLDDLTDKLPAPLRSIAGKVYAIAFENMVASFISEHISSVTSLMTSFEDLNPFTFAGKKGLMHGLPFLQKVVATHERIAQVHPSTSMIGTLMNGASTFFISAITPNVKIRLRSDQVEQLFKETVIPGNAIRYSFENLSAFNFGFVGSLKNGIHLGVPPIFKTPVRVLTGLAMIGGAVTVGFAAYSILPGFIAAHKTAIIVGAIFALV